MVPIQTLSVFLLFFISFTVIYAITWAFTRNIFLTYKFYYYITLGLLYSIISTLTSFGIGVYNNKSIFGSANFLIPILIYFIAINFISFLTAAPIIIINLILLIFAFNNIEFIKQGDGFDKIKIYTYFVYAIITIIPMLKLFFKKNEIKRFDSIFIQIILITIVGMIFKYLNFKNQYSLSIEILIFILALFIHGYFCVILEKIYNHAKKLDNMVSYDYLYYLNNINIEDGLHEFILKNNVKTGIYLNFFIVDYNKFELNTNPKIKDIIMSKIANEAHFLFTKNIEYKKIFLKNNAMTFGVFIDLTKETNQLKKMAFENFLNIEKSKVLYKIKKLLIQLCTNFIVDGKHINIKIKAVASFYGIQGMNTNTLFNMNKWYIKNEKLFPKKTLVFINPNEYNSEKNQRKKIAALGESININSLLIFYEPIYNIKKNILLGNICRVNIDGNQINFNKENIILNKNDKFKINSIFIRYIAFEQLKSIGKKNIDNQICFINYDIDTLSSKSFEISEFINKIKNLNFVPNQISLVLNSYSEIDNEEILFNNIIELKNNGFTISINNLNFENIDENILRILKPDYLFINQNDIDLITFTAAKSLLIERLVKLADTIDCEIIVNNVANYFSYNFLVERNIYSFSGKIIGQSDWYQNKISDDLKFLLQKNKG